MKIEPAARIDGHIGVPGDKSISHRAVLIGALAEGETRIEHFGRSADTESTIAAVRSLGIEVEEEDVDTLVVGGGEVRGLQSGNGAIDCGNAGTLARLLTGILAFQQGRFELTGDESLSRRPMDRVAIPLRQMGADISASWPVVIEGRELTGTEYEPPVARAQVKAAVL